MNNLMTGTLSAIIKQGLEERAKTDADFASKYNKCKVDTFLQSQHPCVNAIYQAFYALAKEGASGGGGVALNGSDDLIISAAVHWYDEDGKASIESIKEILKGGTEVQKMQQPKSAPKAATKPTPKPVPKPVPTIGATKPTPKPVPKPAPKPKPVEDDDEMPDLFG